MLKKTVIYFFLTAFLFQAVVFNVFLYGFTILAKYDENHAKIEQLEFSPQQFVKLKLNQSEFTYNNNLYDVISSKTENGAIKLLCKVDAKEKDFLEKLIEAFKQNKTKKQISFSFLAELHKTFSLKTQPMHSSNIKHLTVTSCILKNSTDKTTPPPRV